MNLIWVVRAALLVLVSIPDLTQAVCTTARVRKNWDVLTTTEKDTFKAALAASMDSGCYIRFVEMHTEMQSEMEAHRQCMFIYWHRLMLVVFENMLRGQGPQFECVTVPYWNWVEANNRLLAGQCSSLGDCSPVLRELGGWTNGTQRTLNINGVSNTGRCVAVSPLNHFCQSGTVSGSACANCVPRNNWGSAPISASLSYASVRAQVFNGKNIGEMSPLIERGCHNNIHANLDGCMQTFAAPSDPIFWLHHSNVDALHTIFHKCRVGTQRQTFSQKASNRVAWTSCAKRNGGVFRPTDVITMRTGVRGNNPVQGYLDALVGKYFTGVPNQYAGLMDVRDLGDNSYTYELSGQLADMYTNCDGTLPPAPANVAPPTMDSPTVAPPSMAPPSMAPPSIAPVTAAPLPAAPSILPSTPVPTANPASVPVTSTPVSTAPPPTSMATPQQPARQNLFDWFRSLWGNNFNNGRRLEADHGWLWLWNNNLGKNVRESDDVSINTSADSSSNVVAATSASSLTTTNSAYSNSSVVAGVSTTGLMTINGDIPSDNVVAASNATASLTIESSFSSENMVVATNATVSTMISPHYDGDNDNVDVILTATTSHEAKLVSDWYDKAMADMGGQCPEVMQDLERQACMYEDQCLGGIPEYSAEFIATWGVKEPRCLTIVKAIKSGEQSIAYGRWREKMVSHFGCPKPANATQPINRPSCYNNVV